MSEGKKLRILKDILGVFYVTNNEYLFFCPKCDHHKRKLSVNLKKNVFKCWVCDYSGRSLQRIVRVHGDYKQRLEWKELTNSVDVLSFSDQLFSIQEEEREQTIKLPEEFVSLANNDSAYNTLYPRNYLKSRGLMRQDMVRWKIGFCATGKYAKHVIIPSFGLTGHCNYFVARSYSDSWKKYLNPPVSRDIIFNHLYLDFDEDLVIVEGAFDAIVAGPNAVPILGSTLRETSRLFQEIARNDTPVYIALDPDAEAKSSKLIKSFLQYGVEVYKIDVAPYSDVGEMSKEEFQKRKLEAKVISSEYYLLNKILNI